MSPDVNRLIQTLHPLERAVIKVLKNGMELREIAAVTQLKEVEVMRALQWLENKSLLTTKAEATELINLDKNGALYVMEGLPERRFLKTLTEEDDLSIDEVQEKAGLTKEEINICIGILKKKGTISIHPRMKIEITDEGRILLEQPSLENEFLRSLPLVVEKLSEEQKLAYDLLRKRKGIIQLEVKKLRFVQLTKEGEALKKLRISDNFIDKLKPRHLIEGTWKNKNFRRYDVKINVPKISYGKRHFVNQAIDSIKRIWLDLGFKEMTGPLVQTSFWNFDALFTPQDHPVREMQDTFFIKDPFKGKLPKKARVDAVKAVHENGGKTGSKGWRYPWNREEAKKNVLRTHTTVLSGQTIAALKESDLPVKFFSIAKCFRNESLDWSHLFEFYQFEGIVIDPKANLGNLMGYLKEFYVKLGYDANKIRMRPAYFPYTEPSIEVDYYHEGKKKWIELCGAGIFRPEMVEPILGKAVPVLAWGGGIERAISEYFSLTDIRSLYKNDLKQLRDIRAWL